MSEELTVTISSAALAEPAAADITELVADRVASKLAAQEPTLWGEAAAAEAAHRLSWTLLPETSRSLLPLIDSLREQLAADGIDRVVLAGMGGSSLAPEVICNTAKAPLTVLDTTDPHQVGDALAGDLTRTVLVVSSKSGTTVETDSHRRIFHAAFREAGVDPGAHMVAVTDPGSPLHTEATAAGYRAVITADPGVGGRYSALTAFGLVPAGLAGVDIAALLDESTRASELLATDEPTNPALVLAAGLAAGHSRGAEKVVLADTGSGIAGLGDWIEQLLAESTGKQGGGLLPVVVEGPHAAGFADVGPDATTVAIGPDAGGAINTAGTLGGQFLLWEYATAIVGRLLKINPFDQPDVEAAKVAAREVLAGAEGQQVVQPAYVEGPIEVFADWLPVGSATVDQAIRALLAATPADGYVAIQAYLDRLDDASIALLRGELSRRTKIQTTFGWGPRFLHSTGQYHKGGYPNGAFLQITGATERDIPVPDAAFSLGSLQLAQARGDAEVLAARGRPVLRLHLADRAAGLVKLVQVIESLEEIEV